MGARSQLFFEDVRGGLQLPQATYGPMDRSAYIPVAIILRDTNPLHLDRGYARERGLPDVVQQGPLNETFLYRFLTALLYRPWDLRETRLRFAANVFPGDLLTCGGVVTRTSRVDGEPRVECDVWQRNQNHETILSGSAAFTLPERGPT